MGRGRLVAKCKLEEPREEVGEEDRSKMMMMMMGAKVLSGDLAGGSGWCKNWVGFEGIWWWRMAMMSQIVPSPKGAIMVGGGKEDMMSKEMDDQLLPGKNFTNSKIFFFSQETENLSN